MTLAQAAQTRSAVTLATAPMTTILPGFRTVNHVCVLGSERAAWFSDSEGNILCIHEEVAPA